MSEFKPSLKRPFALVAVALSTLALAGCGDGGDKTMNIGVACPKGATPRVETTFNNDLDDALVISCEGGSGDKLVPQAVNLPNIQDGAPIKPNFTVAVTANNEGAMWFTQEATPSYDPADNTATSSTVVLHNIDSIKGIHIQPNS